ncbi:NADH-quinone oxidoreductase subunit NuoN [Gimibacter soli]|uniref:NADH-quinone oxidoreductase subunit N n=1 Tax=Gimibacter soli TaxID=3024400 RepID=A0AAE9XPD5_9PROT|nr:NADH-quinone oxidoreductase subunit NuoN [Gimibacter soli]WCL52596.1 NADH-quinone oxidoreductase subunit NuoN [Gimibacter soli]
MTADLPSFAPALPEIVLALGAMALLMLGVFRSGKAYTQVSSLTVFLFILVGVLLVAYVGGERSVTFSGLFVTDSFAIFSKILVLVGSGVALMMSSRYMADHGIDRFEYPVLIALATLGMMIMISANNLMSLYVGLELQSLALYVLAAIHRNRNRATEAGLKYFVLGALSSGMLLYGISLIYGFTGTISFDLLADSVKTGEHAGIGVIVGMVFLIAGFAFKVSAVPFHMWTPDVYEGAPTPVTAFFAAAPKVAALAMFVRAMFGAFGELVTEWQQVVIFISIASMIVGAVIAIVQTNIKRLMAYSSIGHVGYALVGLAAGTEAGVEALLVYIAIYVTMTLGSFAAILSMRRNGQMVEEISDLAGLSQTNLPLAIGIAVFMFSLAGIPILAGFFGKWVVFWAAVEAGLTPLAIVGLLASVISCFYYIRIVKVMFFDEPAGNFDADKGRAIPLVIGVSAVLHSPVSFLLISPLIAAAAWAAKSLIY